MQLTESYQRLTTDCGFVPLSRTRMVFTGSDRVSFLHNLCTAELKRLKPGQGTEAFVTSVQGKILGHVFVFLHDDHLVIDTVPNQAHSLMGHFDHYLITEDVQMHDESDRYQALVLVGPRSPQVLAQAWDAMPCERYAHGTGRAGEVDFSWARVDWTDVPTWMVWFLRQGWEPLKQWLAGQDVSPCDSAAWEALRIESRFPYYGLDITAQNLPQEVDRDAWAISFQKGCYLGQETVARIDALGHVNRKLVRVRVESDTIPPAGTELQHAQRPVGRVTSAAYSLRYHTPLCLAYVRREACQTGTVLECEFGTAGIV